MFDANASHIPLGEKFFAEVHSTDELLVEHGVGVGGILLCEHIEKSEDFCNRNLVTRVLASKDSDPFEWVPEKSTEFSWMVYSGRPNGKGFISERWRQKALDFLGGAFDA